MLHPLVPDISALKDAEIESKISDLSKKYWMTHNPNVQQQMALILEMYQEEMRNRRAKMWNQQYQNRDKGLDDLIKVS